MKNAKILIILIWNVVLFLPLLAQKPPTENRNLEMIEDEIEPSYRLFNMRVSVETRVPLALYKVNYKVQPDSPARMAEQYLRENAGLLKLEPDLSDLIYNSTRETRGGYHVRFLQYVGRYPVYKSEIVVNINRGNLVTFVMNGYKPGAELDYDTPSLSSSDAAQIAKGYLNIQGKLDYEKTELVVYHLKGKSRLVYSVSIVPAEDTFGDWEVTIDARSGEIIRVADKALYYDRHLMANGTGWVFDPDPLTRAGAVYQAGGQFGDNNDNDTDSLVAQIVEVPLLDITYNGTLYELNGPYAHIVDWEAPFKGVFSQADSNFHYTRSPDNFEAVNVYHHVDQSMRYINETLGFNLMPFQYTGGVQVDPHGFNGADNSHYISSTGRIAWGEGGVDDAEDEDVILHELGHGIHDWITNGSLSQVQGLSEGCGDYWAASYMRGTGFWQSSDPQYYWVFQWDGHNEFWSGRITNYSAQYPGGLIGQIHTDGQIWSSTLMQIWNDIGREATDSDFLEALSMTSSSTNQEDAAQAFIQADINLYSGANLSSIEYWFTQRGYTVTIPAPAINHTPLSDTEDLNGPYLVTTEISSGLPLETVQLIHGTDSAFTDTVEMSGAGGLYSAQIPGTGVPTEYRYFIFAMDSNGIASTNPPGAPANYHRFYARPDTIRPVITHTPLRDQAYIRWPAAAKAQIEDNLGIANAWVEYSINNGAINGAFPLTKTSGNLYEGFFDIDTTNVSIGDSIEYRIVAEDSSNQINQATAPDTGYFGFSIIEVLGVILVIDDDPTTSVRKMTDKGLVVRDIKANPFGVSANRMGAALDDVGYLAVIEDADLTDPADWSNYDLIISSSGINEQTLMNQFYREALAAYSIAGGKFIVEGGEVGYDWRNDLFVKTYITHLNSWSTDNAGTMNLISGLSNHPMVNQPNVLPSSIGISYSGWGSQDAMTPLDSYVLYETTTDPGEAGISIYDDNSDPTSAQSVFFAFNFAELLDTTVAKHLLENAVNYLLTPEPTNQAPGLFGLLLPLDEDTVNISIPIDFVWNEAFDPEGDPLTYSLKLFSATFDTIFTGIQDSTFSVDGSAFLANNTVYDWTVSVSDGFSTTASPDTFSFVAELSTGVKDDLASLPRRFALHQNYPNPFNPTTLIRYDLPQSAKVELKIYNILGQEVRTLVNAIQQAGYRSVQWDATNNLGARVGSGVYIYRIWLNEISGSNENIIQSRKMLILK